MKICIAILFFIFMAVPAMAEDDLKISGLIEVHYRYSNDLYANEGDDKFLPEELYLQFEKNIENNIGALIKLDGADMNNNSATHKYVEEAQVIFRNVGNKPLTLIVGKDEMPFGQDYERFLLSSRTHGLEIDKVWGIHGNYEIKGVGSLAAAIFEKDAENKEDVGLKDSFTVRAATSDLLEGLFVEASLAMLGKDASKAEDDEIRLNAGASFKMAALTFHGEFTLIADYDNSPGRDLAVLQFGADYRLNELLLKARIENSDDDLANQEELRAAVGASYYLSSKTFVALEYEKVSKEGAGMDSDEILAGGSFKF